MTAKKDATGFDKWWQENNPRHLESDSPEMQLFLRSLAKSAFTAGMEYQRGDATPAEIQAAIDNAWLGGAPPELLEVLEITYTIIFRREARTGLVELSEMLPFLVGIITKAQQKSPDQWSQWLDQMDRKNTSNHRDESPQ